MSNRTEEKRPEGRPERAIDSDTIRVAKPDWMPAATWAEVKDKITDKLDELVDNARQALTVGKPSESCPAGNAWCRTHEEDDGTGWCTGRTAQVEEAHLDITNGTNDGHLAFYGLSYLPESGIDLDTARQIAETITALIEEVEPEGKPASATAGYTWHDMAATNSLLHDLRLLDAERDDLPFGTEDLAEDARTCPAYGGLLAWNLTRDEEGGHLVMFTGQTPAQEQQVLANAGWMVSCGTVYAASRVGMKGWKAAYDDRCTVAGDELLVWLLPNDTNVGEGMRR